MDKNLLSTSCQNIRLEGTVLKALCMTTRGMQAGSIDLNKYIENRDGTIAWGGKGFADTAWSVRLEAGSDLLGGESPMGGSDIVLAKPGSLVLIATYHKPKPEPKRAGVHTVPQPVDKSKDLVDSSINIEEHIFNVDGVLTYVEP